MCVGAVHQDIPHLEENATRTRRRATARRLASLARRSLTPVVVHDRKMIPDDPALQNFGLIWRFSDAQKYTQLSAAEFQRFRPLPEAESLRRWEELVYPDASPGHRHLTELYVQRLVAWPQSVSFRSDSKHDESQVVQKLKREVTADDTSEAIFFWHAELAVRTDWRLFLDHWDDFCYPSDDSNIMVLPASGKAIAYIEGRWYILDRLKTGTVFPASSK